MKTGATERILLGFTESVHTDAPRQRQSLVTFLPLPFQSVAVVAKPLPVAGVCVFQRMDALTAEHDDRRISVVVKKLV